MRSLVILLLMPSKYKLRLTWKTAMTGRWSEVLMLEQLEYFTTLMSSACLFLNRILSCEHKRRGLDIRCPLLRGGVVDVTADVKFVGGEKGVHVAGSRALHECLHIDPVLTQPEIKVSKPEDLVESCGDVSYN
ncbi:hypothetical protein INR49_017385 [Caranx melampygus]|nr:hypothetical protein INR49_017385 [Caranx melampygus]